MAELNHPKPPLAVGDRVYFKKGDPEIAWEVTRCITRRDPIEDDGWYYAVAVVCLDTGAVRHHVNVRRLSKADE